MARYTLGSCALPHSEIGSRHVGARRGTEPLSLRCIISVFILFIIIYYYVLYVPEVGWFVRRWKMKPLPAATTTIKHVSVSVYGSLEI